MKGMKGEEWEREIQETAEKFGMTVEDVRSLKNRSITEIGRAIREKAEALFEAGKTNAEIAEELNRPEEFIQDLLYPQQLREDLIMWFPGIYEGRKGYRWGSTVADFLDRFNMYFLISMVQKRAKEDGEWCIENGLVGDNEDVMRKMMEWISKPDNIRQCAEANPNETVDWICRDLANGSKWVGGSRG